MAKKKKHKRVPKTNTEPNVGALNKVIKQALNKSNQELAELFNGQSNEALSELARQSPDQYLAPYLLMARTVKTHNSIQMAIERFDYHLAYMGIRAAGEEMIHLAYALHWPKQYLVRLRSQKQIFFYNLLRNFGRSDYYPPEQINQVLLSLYLDNKEELSGRSYTTNNRYLRQCIKHLDELLNGEKALMIAHKPEAVQKFIDAMQALHKLPVAINAGIYSQLSNEIGFSGTELLGKGVKLHDVIEQLQKQVGNEIF